LADNKKYYYLKLKSDFYDREEVRIIEGLENGYEYIAIMMKMYLKSLKRGGKLMITDRVPYDVVSLASALGHKQETVAMAVKLFEKYGLIDILDGGEIYLLEIENFIGKSTTEADRVRAFRKRVTSKKHGEQSEIDFDKPEQPKPQPEIVKNDNLNTIIDHWNTHKLPQVKKRTDRLKRALNGVLNDGYNLEQIKESIIFFDTILNESKYYWSYKWRLEDFLKRSSGCRNFIDVPDLKNYEKRNISKVAVNGNNGGRYENF